jgi:hypothetical protein
MGIVSFVALVLSIGTGLVMLVMICAMSASNFRPADEQSPVFYVIGGWVFSTVVLSLVGVVFGIGGLLQKGRRHHFAAIGLAGNVVTPLTLMAILVCGLTYRTPTAGIKPMTLDAPDWDSPVAIVCAAICIGLLVAILRRFNQKRIAARPAMTNCPQCNKGVPAAARFCRRCGHGFEVPMPQPASV